MSFKKKGHAYCVEWDFDASSSEYDDEKTPSKSLAGIIINKKPSLFDTIAQIHRNCLASIHRGHRGNLYLLGASRPSIWN
jgi:hypothetical protein